jgi:hypothetical protein
MTKIEETLIKMVTRIHKMTKGSLAQSLPLAPSPIPKNYKFSNLGQKTCSNNIVISGPLKKL